ncbi:hypothetical protein OOK44_36020 [Streptomyces cellulosae]|uniref:Uncharacterized protein n=1 Tax=Streptomyces althioticus TaxID=83380 RepID=A0ABZ1YI80_9ACTN|nr:hypothetical protein [Streptomyces cellulosae]WTB93410.1 hypothetical protein OIE99_34770 [Streptomyces cellulosae]WTC60801.1 hypothetical protein OH715_36520 [Streptomyces cellulosae]
MSSRTDAPPATAQALQVRVLADAYGLGAEARARLVDAMLDRQERNARWWSGQLTRPGPRIAEPGQIAERIRWSEREYAFTAAHRAVFTAAL